MEDPELIDVHATSRRTRSDPYSKLKKARFLPPAPRNGSIEINHPTISLDIPNFPRIIKTAASGELPRKIECKLGGNWKACGARGVTLDIYPEKGEDEYDGMFLIDSIIHGKKDVLIQRDGTVTFELEFITTSKKYGDTNFILEFSVVDVGEKVLLVQKSPSFFVYSHWRMISSRANVEIRTICPEKISLVNGGELHLIGKTFFEGSRLKVFMKIGDLYTEVQSCSVYSKTVLYVQIPPCPVDVDEMCNEVEAEIMVSNDEITHSNVVKMYYIR